jgi:hypothetical protein
MRDPKRIPEMMNIVGMIWMKWPDMRLGQIIECAHSLALQNMAGSPDIFMIEDDRLMLGLQLLSETE